MSKFGIGLFRLRAFETPVLRGGIPELMDRAREARANAYCPYGKCPVGAALLAIDDQIYLGVGVENSCLGLSVCAERCAIYSAVAHGQRRFRAMAICCDIRDDFQASCGACRQVIAEFCPNLDIYLVKPDKSYVKVNSVNLLPPAFSSFAEDEQEASF